jgi:hypothetical protein
MEKDLSGKPWRLEQQQFNIRQRGQVYIVDMWTVRLTVRRSAAPTCDSSLRERATAGQARVRRFAPQTCDGATACRAEVAADGGTKAGATVRRSDGATARKAESRNREILLV